LVIAERRRLSGSSSKEEKDGEAQVPLDQERRDPEDVPSSTVEAEPIGRRDALKAHESKSGRIS